MSDIEKIINASDLIEWIIETYPDWCVGAVRSIVDHIEAMPSAQPETCAYWDKESNICALHRPSAQPNVHDVSDDADYINRETMKDLIDITTWYHQNRNNDMVEGASDEETAWFKAKDVFKAIENVPSAQRKNAVIDRQPTIEIVRCKDCKYNPNNPRLYADNDPIETFIHCQFMEASDFCSKGKAITEVQIKE